MPDSHHSPAHKEEPSGEEIAAIIADLKQAIWSRRPILGEIMQKHGDKILHLYSKDFMDINASARLDARKPELIGHIQAMVEARLGKEVADGVGKQMRKFPLVSTTDHHGPIDHPFFVNANIISGIPYAEQNDPDLRYLVVLSFASVSVNNASAYPRGILVHGGVGEAGNLIRLPILPDKVKMGVVYGMRPFTREDLTKAEAELSKKEKAGDIAEGRGEKIRQRMEEFFARPDVLGSPDLNSQITIINYHLWPRLFHAPAKEPDAAQGIPVPDLLYVEIETLVTDVLRTRHLNDPSSLLHRALFEPRFQELCRTHFEGIPGAFSAAKDWGTYFFWGMDEKLHRVRLKLENGMLRSADGTIAVEWNPHVIEKALAEKKIFPSMITCYLTVALYYGMKCLGGFCQVNDLTYTKEAWSKILREMGENDEADALVPVQTKELGGDGMVLPYYPTSTGDFVPATGIDMLLFEGETRFDKYAARSKQVTLSEMMNPMLPEIYTVLFPVTERDPRLLSLTPEQILRETGLQRKLVEGFDS